MRSLARERRIRRDVEHARAVAVRDGATPNSTCRSSTPGRISSSRNCAAPRDFGQRLHAQRRPSWAIHRIVGDVVGAHFEIADHVIRIDGPGRPAIGEQQQGPTRDETLANTPAAARRAARRCPARHGAASVCRCRCALRPRWRWVRNRARRCPAQSELSEPCAGTAKIHGESRAAGVGACGQVGQRWLPAGVAGETDRTRRVRCRARAPRAHAARHPAGARDFRWRRSRRGSAAAPTRKAANNTSPSASAIMSSGRLKPRARDATHAQPATGNCASTCSATASVSSASSRASRQRSEIT